MSPDKALAVLVGVDGTVENRLIDMPAGLPPSALTEASNYMSANLRGRSLESARGEILKEIEEQRAELDELTAKIVAEGLATLSARPPGTGDSVEDKILIVRGASNLLDNIEAHGDLERIRTLFDEIERRGDLINLLEMAKAGEGVEAAREVLRGVLRPLTRDRVIAPDIEAVARIVEENVLWFMHE